MVICMTYGGEGGEAVVESIEELPFLIGRKYLGETGIGDTVKRGRRRGRDYRKVRGLIYLFLKSDETELKKEKMKNRKMMMKKKKK